MPKKKKEIRNCMIRVTQETKTALDQMKVIPEEPYDKLITRMLKAFRSWTNMTIDILIKEFKTEKVEDKCNLENDKELYRDVMNNITAEEELLIKEYFNC